ncbi:MAG: SPOR domain-containing protein [Gammaproteobacteria bacterium]|nr:SPOR domain-containing protein [Gammaproteobacteria bacterium]
MPRDYKNRAQKQPPKKPLPGWLWLLTGLLLGGFIAALFWLHGQSDDAGGEWVGAKPDRPPQGAVEKRAEPPAPPKPRFDFYDMLPRMEVEVPEAELREKPPAAAPAPATTAATEFHLQVGSFKRAEDADRRKAELTLLGFEVNVTRARIGPDDTRYRVRSGPYRGTAAVNQARRRLSDSGFDSIVIRSASQ